MKLYNLDKRYKKFIETLVDGYVKGKTNMENGSNPYISEPGMLFNSMFYDFTNDYVCNLIFHKTEDNNISVCYVFDSRLIKDECADKYEAQEKFINIQCSDFIYKLSLLSYFIMLSIIFFDTFCQYNCLVGYNLLSLLCYNKFG